MVEHWMIPGAHCEVLQGRTWLKGVIDRVVDEDTVRVFTASNWLGDIAAYWVVRDPEPVVVADPPLRVGEQCQWRDPTAEAWVPATVTGARYVRGPLEREWLVYRVRTAEWEFPALDWELRRAVVFPGRAAWRGDPVDDIAVRVGLRRLAA